MSHEGLHYGMKTRQHRRESLGFGVVMEWLFIVDGWQIRIQHGAIEMQ